MMASGRARALWLALGINLGCGFFENLSEPAGAYAPPETCLRPTAGIGDECHADSACIQGLGCVAGRCAAPAGVGASCQDSGHCLDGLLCTEMFGTDIGVCHEPGSRRFTETCLFDSSCIEGICNGALGSTCAPPSELGEPCFSSRDCADDLRCSVERLCQEAATNGEPCRSNDECAGGYCRFGDDPPRCRDGLVGSVGEPCSIRAPCAEGLTCHRAMGDVCSPPSALGEPCELGRDCDENLRCSESEPRVCQTGDDAEPGARCYQDWECPSGTVCGYPRTCIEIGSIAFDQPCEQDAECSGDLRCGFPGPSQGTGTG